MGDKPTYSVERISDDTAKLLRETLAAGQAALGASPFLKKKNIFEEKKRKKWDNSIEARCDFSLSIRSEKRAGVRFMAIWKKTLYGRTLKEIKEDDDMVPFFAKSIAPIVCETVGENLAKGDWAICTSPKRRHKERNFATLVAHELASLLQIPSYEDVAECKSKQRIGAVFNLLHLPKEQNIIVFDDIVTTGSTLQGMRNLLADEHHKNVVFFAGINNKL